MRALVACVAFAFASVALGGDIQVAVYQVEMSQGQMSGLLAEGLPDAELFDRARGMVETKAARLHDSSLIRLKAGQKATLESIREFIYPSEYEPDSFAHLGRDGKPIVLTEEQKKRQQEEWRREWLASMFFPVVGGVLHDFETRNVGLSLEIGVDEELRNLVWQLETVAHVHDSIMGQALGLDGKPWVMKLPNFDTTKIDGSSGAAKGTVLAGVVTPVAVDGTLARERKILVFVKTDLLEAK